jgi:hypothetical protein
MGELQADFPIWLYILFGVIYLISRLRKKPAQPTDFPEYGPENPAPNPGKNQPGRVETPASPQMTFEELLREITEGKTVRKEKSVPEVSYESYEDVVADEEKDQEVIDKNGYRSEDKVVAAYEEAKRQAFLRPSLEETMDLKNTDVTYGRFKGFEKEVQRNLLQEYMIDFKDPEGLKKAVVMSEILQRKF